MLRGPIFYLFQLNSLCISFNMVENSVRQSKELHFLSRQITTIWADVTTHSFVLISNISCSFSPTKRGWGRTAVLRNQEIYKFQQKCVFLSPLNRGYWGCVLEAASNCQIFVVPLLSYPESAVKCNSSIFSSVIYILRKIKKMLGAWTFQTTWPQAMV